MKISRIIGLLALVMAHATGALATPIHIGLSSYGNAVVSSQPGTFSFQDNNPAGSPNLPGAFDFVIDGASPADVLGKLGNIGGTFTIGTITTIAGLSTAPVSGTGTFSIADGSGFTFTSTLTWIDIAQFGSANTLNTTATVNLSAFSYLGTNSTLLALLGNGDGNFVVTFQFNPAISLATFRAGNRSTSYQGTLDSGAQLSEVPEPGSLLLLGGGLLAVGTVARRKRSGA